MEKKKWGRENGEEIRREEKNGNGTKAKMDGRCVKMYNTMKEGKELKG